jgi:hypothetical protein
MRIPDFKGKSRGKFVENSIEPSNIRSNPVKKFDSNRIELYVIRFDRIRSNFDRIELIR